MVLSTLNNKINQGNKKLTHEKLQNILKEIRHQQMKTLHGVKYIK